MPLSGSSSGYSFTRSSNGFIWSRLSRKKMRRRPFLLPPCPSLSFHFRFHLRPFNTGGGLACRPPPPSACTGWLSAGSWTWSIGPLGRGRLVGGEIHSEYQDQAALAAPAALDQVAGHWAGCKRHPPAAAKRPSAIIEACEHSWNPWCGLSNVVYSARTVWTRYRQMPAGIFYVEHMDGCLKELGFQ